MTSPTIAVFGATGGCAQSALAHALTNGHTCRALTRSNPEKLKTALLARGISQDVLNSHLTVLQGDAKDKEIVKETLRCNGSIVNKILYGIGLAEPIFQFSLITPITLADPRVCESTLATVLQAASDLQNESSTSGKPDIYLISTTGISKGPRDVPILCWPFYHWLLKVMHDDKKKMENLVRSSANSPERGFAEYRIVRASLLMDGDEQGLKAIRTGSEAQPSIGYTINRKDVGLWIYKRWLESPKAADENGAYTITY